MRAEVFGDRINNAMGFVMTPEMFENAGGMQLGVMNDRKWRATETLSANVAATARGLCELGGFFANRGTFRGKTLMSEDSWE